MNKSLAASLMLLSFSLGCLVTGQRYGAMMDERKDLIERAQQTAKTACDQRDAQYKISEQWKERLEESEFHRATYAYMVMRSQPIDGGCWIVSKQLADDAKGLDDTDLLNYGFVTTDHK